MFLHESTSSIKKYKTVAMWDSKTTLACIHPKHRHHWGHICSTLKMGDRWTMPSCDKLPFCISFLSATQCIDNLHEFSWPPSSLVGKKSYLLDNSIQKIIEFKICLKENGTRSPNTANLQNKLMSEANTLRFCKGNHWRLTATGRRLCWQYSSLRDWTL